MFDLKDDGKNQQTLISSTPVMRAACNYEIPDTCMKPLYPEKSSGLPILFYFPAWAQLWEHACADPCQTKAGILTGGLIHDENGSCIIVTGFMSARYSKDKACRLTFLNHSWVSMDKQFFSNENKKKCVGSFHMHYGQGAYLSRQDLSLFKYFADGEGQIALVLDPSVNDYSLYCQQNNEMPVSRNVHFFSGSREHLQEHVASFINQMKQNQSEESSQIDLTADQNESADPVNKYKTRRKIDPLYRLDIRIDDLHFDQAYEQVYGGISARLDQMMSRVIKSV